MNLLEQSAGVLITPDRPTALAIELSFSIGKVEPAARHFQIDRALRI